MTGFDRVIKRTIDYRAANLERTIDLTVAFLHAPADAIAAVAGSPLLLTSAQLEGFTRDGTVDRWLGQSIMCSRTSAFLLTRCRRASTTKASSSSQLEAPTEISASDLVALVREMA